MSPSAHLVTRYPFIAALLGANALGALVSHGAMRLACVAGALWALSLLVWRIRIERERAQSDGGPFTPSGGGK